MRKLFLTMSLLVATVAAWAWDAPDNNQSNYEDRMVLPLNITVTGADNAVAAPRIEVAAFIDGVCRAVVTETTSYDVQKGDAPLYVYKLDIYGTREDAGKSVIIKAMYNSLAYLFPTTYSYEYATSAVQDLTLDPLAGVELTNPITIEKALPAEYDLSNDFRLVYGSLEKPVYKPAAMIDETETPLSYVWDAANSAPYFTVGTDTNPNLLQTTEMETPAEGAGLILNVNTAAGTIVTGWTTVIVKKATIAVESIIINPAAITLQVGENLEEALRKIEVTVMPEEASNKDYRWKFQDGEEAWATEGVVTTAGTHHVVFYALGDESKQAILTVTVPEPVIFTYPSTIVLSLLSDKVINLEEFLTFTSGKANCDYTKVEIMPNDELFNGDSPFKAEASEDGKTWTLRGKYTGEYAFIITYDGNDMNPENSDESGKVVIPVDIPLASGWNWISAYAIDGRSYALKANGDYQAQVNALTEIRSQSKILFKDPRYGFFGDLESIEVGNMYKVNTPEACDLTFGSIGLSQARDLSYTFNPGYTWFAYPHEFDLTLEEAQEMFAEVEATEGDRIIGKESFLSYNGQQWEGAVDFKLEAGKGYIYYNAGKKTISDVSLYFNDVPSCYIEEPQGNPTRIKAKELVHVWDVQSANFADNMTIIATIQGLCNPENYLIGAFVGDECRGEGSVASGDLMFITIAGEAGEEFSFRLYNKFTGEISAISERIAYSHHTGSFKAPLRLSAPTATGISHVKAACCDDKAVFNMAGQKLSTPRKGVNIIGGQKIVF
ncbi:MAG: hypothetical protein J6W75_02095 [Bacteroidaceae bacterium]|nr:hypothetical protein [Bacteroidaceae bacterium]